MPTEALLDLYMGAFYLSEIGDDAGLEELQLELRQCATENPERTTEFEALLESIPYIG